MAQKSIYVKKEYEQFWKSVEKLAKKRDISVSETAVRLMIRGYMENEDSYDTKTLTVGEEFK